MLAGTQTLERRAFAFLVGSVIYGLMLRRWIRSGSLVVGAVVGVVTLALYLTTLAPTLSWGWRDLGVDGGELLAAANTLGIPHPPGYPTYMLLLKFFATIIPVGDFAYRGNLFSGVLGAATVVLLYWVILRCCAQIRKSAPDWLRIWGGAFGAATLASSPLFWSQSIVTEVYTLNTLFAVILLLITTHVVFDQGGDHRKKLAIFGLVLGLGLGNHLTLLAVAVPLIFWMCSVVGWRRGLSIRAIVGLAVGLSIYMYLPIRAAQTPPVNWGNADSLSGFGWMLTGGPYQEYLLGVSVNTIGDRLIPWLNLVFSQFNPLGLFFGLVAGGVLLSKAARLLATISASVVLLTIYSISYKTVDYQVLMLPAFLMFSVLVGIGFFWVLSTWLFPALQGDKIVVGRFRMRREQIVVTAAIFIFALVPVVSIILNFGSQNLRSDRVAYEYASGVIDLVPVGSIVLSDHEKNAFSLWYMRHVDNLEPNFVPVAVRLLQFDWYRRDLHELYPSVIPDVFSNDVHSVMETIIEYNNPGGVYFTFNPRFVSDRFSVERLDGVWKVTMSGDG